MTRGPKSNIYKHTRFNLRRPKTDGFFMWPEIALDERIMDNFLERLAETEQREAEAAEILKSAFLRAEYAEDSTIEIEI
ncbi:hypothetical protein [Yaravirus sp. 'brasiliensis']|uniref:Uncharacterized protein n=1 Tax=Yaravirus sp. 'brasiliensis' TaxID=2739681 RepID=A0AAE7B7W3_9VIRU|nr:hypothetical protein QKS73_gp60 [Yaravirus brasiliensis]QKE44417.1 hypothetical protein [Yaravirus brasiliensis]